MMRLKDLSAAILLLAATFAMAAEIKPLFKLADMAERFGKTAPEHVKFSMEQDALVMTISAVDRRGGFDGTHSISQKPLAGWIMTIMIDVRLCDLKKIDGTPARSVGKLSVGGSTQHLVVSSSEWRTYTFKSVKIPGNGLLKVRLSVPNVSGEIRIRNPRIKGDMPKAPRDKKKRDKKKNKTRKNNNN